MLDALSGVDGTQPLPPSVVYPDALSGADRRLAPAAVMERAERERQRAEQRVVDRGTPSQRPTRRGGAAGAELARQTATVPDAHGSTQRSSVVPEQNLVVQGSQQPHVPGIQPYRR